MNKITFLLTAILITQAFVSQAFAQGKSSLTAIDLPAGDERIDAANVPGQFNETLAKLVAAGGEDIRQGESEVLVWGGNGQKGRGAQLMKTLETAWTSAGWQFEIAENNNDYVIFTLLRAAPSRRGVVGFFVPAADGLVLVMSEMLRASPAETERQSPSVSGGAGLSIYGKWRRSKGGGFIDYTGKTNYNSVENFYFEFSPDGSVEYTRQTDVLSIVQCRIKGEDNARGRFTIAGGTLTITLAAGRSWETNSCNSAENFNKTLPPATVKMQFEIKKLESVTRPDKPTVMCFEGGEDVCYEKINQ